jgi:hypothetical protein
VRVTHHVPKGPFGADAPRTGKRRERLGGLRCDIRARAERRAIQQPVDLCAGGARGGVA